MKCNEFFPKRKIIDFSEMKEFADDNFAIDENGGKFSGRIENAVGKGEIALLFPQSFQKTCNANTLKQGIIWKRVKPGSWQRRLMHFYDTC